MGDLKINFHLHHRIHSKLFNPDCFTRPSAPAEPISSASLNPFWARYLLFHSPTIQNVMKPELFIYGKNTKLRRRTHSQTQSFNMFAIICQIYLHCNTNTTDFTIFHLLFVERTGKSQWDEISFIKILSFFARRG